MILVTGATGHLGRAVVDALLILRQPQDIAGLVRDPQKAADLDDTGIVLRVGDYDDTAALDRAMDGVERVLLISGTDEDNRIRQHGNVIAAATRAGVALIAYTGRAMRDPAASANQLMDGHFGTEDLVRASGMTYVLFRNALYMDTLPIFFGGERVFETGIRIPAGGGQVAYAMRQELGEAIAKVLHAGVSESRTMLLTAHEAWSFDDVAAALTAISGRPVAYTATDKAAFEAMMGKAGLPDARIRRIYGFYCDIRDGQLDEVSPELEALLGRQPAGLKEGLRTLFRL
jgi:NAD(P)H dehydrogenase (quinone)